MRKVDLSLITMIDRKVLSYIWLARNGATLNRLSDLTFPKIITRDTLEL